MSEHPCKFESRILQIIEDIAAIKATTTAIDKRINGSIDDIKTHIEHGNKWRIAICGVSAVLLLSLLGGAVIWGEMKSEIAHLNRIHEK